MDKQIIRKINDLKNDRIHGANQLSIKALNILNLAIKETRADTIGNFVNEIETIATVIIKARSNMTSIANYISQLLNQIMVVSCAQKQLDYVKNIALIKANELIKYAREAALKAAEHGAEMITDQDTVITCSYSSTVCLTFEIAKKNELKFHVIIAESRYKEKAYGEISAKHLRQYQIPITIINDEDINKHVSRTNKVLTGADTILADGSVINGTPTCRLAQAASTANIPFYPICETAKINVKNINYKQLALEPGFDVIPSNLITAIVTEAGVIEPHDIANYIPRYQ